MVASLLLRLYYYWIPEWCFIPVSVHSEKSIFLVFAGVSPMDKPHLAGTGPVQYP